LAGRELFSEQEKIGRVGSFVKMLKILNLEPQGYCQPALDTLNLLGKVDDGPLTRKQLLKKIADYHVLVTQLGHNIDKEVLSQAENLKAIVTNTTGLDHIDIETAKIKKIAVLSLKGETDFLSTVTATAEHTWGMLLALLRNIPAAHFSVIKGKWERNRFIGNDLYGKTLGIIGYGRLGRMVAGYGLAFGMEVITYDPYANEIGRGVRSTGFEELLKTSDVVSLHVPLNAETVHLLGSREFALMRPGALLINTSRGKVVDEKALLKVIKNGKLAGAALDVLEDERNFQGKISSLLIKYAAQHDNLIITPHIGGATHDSMQKTELFVINRLKQWLEENT
jgi:D-3-phosphoglycerate dehydrogenase